MSSSIVVAIRVKPEEDNQLCSHLKIQPKNIHIHVNSVEYEFVFDKVFDSSTSQEQIFQDCGINVIENVLDGFNGTILAYGQTG